jgi:cholesterol transport system auxiliary component
VVVRLDALLVRGADQRILASKRFEVRQPLSDVKVPAVVTGFGQATDQLTAQVVVGRLSKGRNSRRQRDFEVYTDPRERACSR